MGLIIKEIVKIGENRLNSVGCMDAKLDAQLLFCYMMNIDRMQYFMLQPETLGDKLCERYFDLLEERASGRPLQYITGSQEFMGMGFMVDERVLIPRQDTETLVEEVIDILRQSGKKHQRILDLCTGSGAIAISLERYLNSNKFSDEKPLGVDITATDISPKALEVAKQNASKNAAKVKFIESDLFEAFEKRKFMKKFDLIVSNPPYIESAVIPTLQREVAQHEPRLALDGGEDGLDIYRQIIKKAPSYLKEEGILIMEIGSNQAKDIESLATDQGYLAVEIKKDLAGKDRIAILKTPSRSSNKN